MEAVEIVIIVVGKEGIRTEDLRRDVSERR